MAEIEVLLDFGTPYVRLDDYNAMKERYWRQAGLTQTADDEAVTWKEHARALTARVAELEAALAARPSGYLAALDARDAALSVLQRIAALVDVPGNVPFEDIVSAVERLAAAQGWRPVTEKPTAQGRYLVWCPAPWPGYEIAPYDRGWGYVDLRFTHWQPLPPAPQEPTP
jgi:hypothetical protein